ncbi:MAG: bifunctional folylpolyglutamate synthase/dihydrofolate synthase [Clostridia bacterium]|nr:bifunctional folylpolyglutamate synthase/dihydrofolate synthase [Clostridia bacterium]
MDYSESLDYIQNISRSGSDYGLERMRELLDILGSPDDHLKFIHVAGTNGKGSVTAYLTSVLKAAGYNVGTYNSPSVFLYNERWLINGIPLKDEDVAKYMSIVRETIENEQKLRSVLGIGEFNPTAFEIETAVAILSFYEKECDVVVLETGLGGRWDATNAVNSKELAVITRIGLDHCYLLGNTLGEIASEKAAIIRKEAVTCPQSDEVMNEIKHPHFTENGEEKHIDTDLYVAEGAESVSYNISGQEFDFEGDRYRIKLLGDHQIENASIAVKAVKVLRKKHFNISDEALKKGLETARWGARFEVVENAEERFNIVIPEGKTLIFDGSHNPQGAKTLTDAVKQLLKGRHIHLVLGILKDKDYNGIVDELLNVADSITAVTPPSPRALDKDELLKTINNRCKADSSDDIKQAVQDALNKDDADVVILCGSLTLFEILG